MLKFILDSRVINFFIKFNLSITMRTIIFHFIFFLGLEYWWNFIIILQFIHDSHAINFFIKFSLSKTPRIIIFHFIFFLGLEYWWNFIIMLQCILDSNSIYSLFNHSKILHIIITPIIFFHFNLYYFHY